MRSRDIKPGFFKNDQLADCSMAARLLFPGLWMIADREGRLENRPKKIKGEIFPFDDVDVASLLAELERAGLIRFYEVNGQNLIWIPQFKKHQSPHKNEKSSEFPAHPDDLYGMRSEQEQAKDGNTPEMDRSTPVISGQIPLTPSSLTPSSLSPRDISTPDGVVVGAESADETKPGEKRQARTSPACPYEAIVGLYHEAFPEHPQVAILSAKRKGAMKARWSEAGERLRMRGRDDSASGRLDYFRRLFAKAAQSDFLTGRKAFRDGSVYRVDFDKLMSPGGFAGVIEGKYDNSREVA